MTTMTKTMFNLAFIWLMVNACSAAPQVSNVGQFGVMMGCLLDMPTAQAGLEYNGYGCYCGFGGEGIPLDGTDSCCQAHDDCYTAVQTSDMCRGENQAYTILYEYETRNCGSRLASVTCMDESAYEPGYAYTDCAVAMCACDREGARCFQQNRDTYNRDYIRYGQEDCGLSSK